MKKNLAVCCLLILTLALTACNSAKIAEENKRMADSHYKMGLSYFTESNISGALKELFKAYEYDPDNIEVNNLLGLAYLSKRELSKAETHLKSAIRLKKDDFPKARNNLGIVYLEMKRYDDAIIEFDKAASNILYGTPEYAYTNLGWAYYKKGDMVSAIKYYNKSIETEPRYSLPYFNLGLLYSDLEKYSEAEKEYKRAIKFFPNYVDAWYNLALIHFKTKEPEKANEAFSKVIELAPDSNIAEKSQGYIELLK